MGTTFINPFLLGASRYVLNVTISSDTNNYNMRAAALAAGWDGVMPLDMSVTRAAGIIIGSTSASVPAFDTDDGSGFPATSTLYFDNSAATGKTQGKGGAGLAGKNISFVSSPIAGTNGNPGGTALKARWALTVNQQSTGTILGGGGGGASGPSAGLQLTVGKSYETWGTGGSASGGGRGTTGGASSTGGVASGTNHNLNGNDSTAGTDTANGTGGASAQQNGLGDGADAYCRGAAGGNGGGAGSAGANSSASTASAGTHSSGGIPYTAAGATGGAAGNAIEGNSNITYVDSLTGTRTGPIT